MTWFEIAVLLIIVWLWGVICGKHIKNKPKIPDGIFHVDLSDPEDELFRLEYLNDINDIANRNELYFKVHVKK